VVRVSAPPENEFGAPLLSREKATGGTQNTANMTAYRDGVGPSPWGGGGASLAPSKCATGQNAPKSRPTAISWFSHGMNGRADG